MTQMLLSKPVRPHCRCILQNPQRIVKNQHVPHNSLKDGAPPMLSALCTASYTACRTATSAIYPTVSTAAFTLPEAMTNRVSPVHRGMHRPDGPGQPVMGHSRHGIAVGFCQFRIGYNTANGRIGPCRFRSTPCSIRASEETMDFLSSESTPARISSLL